MAELKTLRGILALIDVVNFTGQAANLGDKYTAQYTDYFQEKLRTIVEKRGFHVVKYLGDAVLIFGTEPGGIIDIMKDLFEVRHSTGVLPSFSPSSASSELIDRHCRENDCAFCHSLNVRSRLQNAQTIVHDADHYDPYHNANNVSPTTHEAYATYADRSDRVKLKPSHSPHRRRHQTRGHYQSCQSSQKTRYRID